MTILMQWVYVMLAGLCYFSENNQEAYDNLIMAHQIAENKDVLLPFNGLPRWIYYISFNRKY